MMRAAGLCLLVALPAGCVGLPRCTEVPILAIATVAEDFDSYEMKRVGLMPFNGDRLDAQQASTLQSAFYAEFSRGTPYELVQLDQRDLEEIESSDPHRRGLYEPGTIIATARRYRLDGILFGTVMDQQFFPPQTLSVQVDLVASETGQVVWSSKVHLDANDARVRDGLMVLYADETSTSGTAWELGLLAPSRFARLAAYQIASLL